MSDKKGPPESWAEGLKPFLVMKELIWSRALL